MSNFKMYVGVTRIDASYKEMLYFIYQYSLLLYTGFKHTVVVDITWS